MIIAIFYLLIGLIVSILVFIKSPKIEFQIPREFEQLEKDIAEWLETPLPAVSREISMTTSLDTGLIKRPHERPMTTISTSAFEKVDELQIAGQAV